MKKNYLNSLLLLIVMLLSISFNSCKKDKDDNDNNNVTPPPATGETVLTSTEATIGSKGGTLNLSDSSNVVIPAKALNADTKIKLSKIGKEKNFGDYNKYSYDITGLPEGTVVTFNFACPKDKDPGLVGVLNYDPDAGIPNGIMPPFSYDADKGIIKVENYTLQKKLSGCKYRRWIVEWGDKPKPGELEILIPMPYYEQILGSCWAADATMLAKSYTPYFNREKEMEIKDFLKAMNIETDAGIKWQPFLKQFPYAFNTVSGGAGATAKTFIIMDNAVCEIVTQLAQGKPSILQMLNKGHAVLVVGYKVNLDKECKDWELILHDSQGINPPNSKEGTMYTNRKWSWILDGITTLDWLSVLYSDNPPHPDRTLQTVSLPSIEGSHNLQFEYLTDKGSKGTVNLFWDYKAKDGYSWVMPNKDPFTYLPASTNKLIMKLQLYNANLDKQIACNFNVKITDTKANKTTYDNTFPVALPNDRTPYLFNLSLDTAQWINSKYDVNQPVPYKLETKLSFPGSNTYLDGWALNFTFDWKKPEKYLTSYNYPTRTMTYTSFGLDRCSVDIDVTVSGGKFRIKPYSDLLHIPPVTGSPVTYNFNIKISNIKKLPDAECDGDDMVVYEAYVSLWPNSGNNPTISGNEWNIPVVVDKNSKTINLSTWMNINTESDGSGCFYSFNPVYKSGIEIDE